MRTLGNNSRATPRRALSTRWLGDDAIYWPLPNAPQQGGLAIEGLAKGSPLMDADNPRIAARFPLVAA